MVPGHVRRTCLGHSAISRARDSRLPRRARPRSRPRSTRVVNSPNFTLEKFDFLRDVLAATSVIAARGCKPVEIGTDTLSSFLVLCSFLFSPDSNLFHSSRNSTVAGLPQLRINSLTNLLEAFKIFWDT